jgi:hypothetical protein
VTATGAPPVTSAPAAPADAIAAYDALFAGSAGERLAADTQGALDGQLARRGLVFGEDAATARPLCTVLRPRLLTARQHRTLMARTGALARAFAQGHRLAAADAGLRAHLRLNAWEEQLLAAAPAGELPSPTSRLDLFVVDTAGDGGAVACTEYNAETPAGAGFNDALAESFLALPAMRAFTRRWHALPLLARHGVAASLLEAWAAHQARGGSPGVRAPRIGILDWADVATRQEFVLFQDHFRTLGLECVIADPTACAYHDGALWAPGGERIDLVYKRVLLHELVERAGIDTPVLRAWAAGAVCLVNPPSCKLMHKKASLAFLSDERNAPHFDAEAREAIGTMIPWTRVVEERHTEHRGTAVDLVPHILRHRDQFVLKPNDDYGGAGIVLGWTVDEGEWEAAVAHALADPYVVQERVAIPSEPYPSWVDGGVVVAERMIDTAPFVSSGAAADGVLTRLSTAALLNVTAGGGSTVPSFVVEPR